MRTLTRLRRGRLAAIPAAILALALVAASEPPPDTTTPAGTATASLTALDLSVTGVPIPAEGVRALELTGYASTDPDTARNSAGVPFALIEAIPVRIGQQTVGAVNARSDGERSATANSVDEDAGPVSAEAATFGIDAVADAVSALAVLEGAAAQLGALEGAIGFAVSDTGIETRVNRTTARAVQGLRASGLQIDLGDILPDLSQLPLDVVIALADQLSGQLGGVVGTLAGTVSDLADQVDAGLGQLSTAVGDYETTATELESVLALIGQLESQLTELQAALLEAEQTLASGDTSTVDTLLEEGNELLNETTDLLTDAGGGLLALNHTPVHTLEELVSSLEGQITAVETQLGILEADADALVDELVTILTTVRGLVQQLDGLVGQLLAAVQDLLAELPAVLDAIAAADLVDVGALTLGLSATATANSSEAILGCAVAHVRVAGLDLPAPDCTEPLVAASGQAAAALSKVEQILGALPLVGDVLPEASLQMFSDASAEETVDGAYRRARAHVTALEFDLGSLELGAVTDGLLDGLTDAQLSALLQSLADTLGTDAAGLLGTVTEVADAIDQTLGSVSGTVGGVIDVETTLSGLLANLPAADALAGLSTPGLRLVIDPTVTAEFRPPTAAPADPAPSGPDGEPEPSLPVTGGERGLLLLAALAFLSGAVLTVSRHGREALVRTLRQVRR